MVKTAHLPCFAGSASWRFLGSVVINTRTRAPSGLLILNPLKEKMQCLNKNGTQNSSSVKTKGF